MRYKIFSIVLLLVFTGAAVTLSAQKVRNYTIIVLGKGNQPLYDAKVTSLTSESRTNAEGELKYKSHLAWVTISAAGYHSRKINLETYPEGSMVTVKLGPLPEDMQGINIYVKDKNNKPVANAAISVMPGVSAVTDASGYAATTHKQQPGEYVVIRVQAKGYKTQQQRVLVGVGQGTAVTRADDVARFVLEKGENETAVYRIVVEVLDEDSNEPVKGAAVKLQLSDGTSQEGSTNGKGELLFTDMEYGYEGTTGRVMVTHKDYTEKWSDITADLMTAKDRDDRRFVVFVKRKSEDLSGKWDIKWVDPYASYTFEWEIRSSGAGWQVKHKLLSTNHGENRKLIGQSWDDITLVPAGDGTFTLRRASNDTNPGNPGFFEQTATCSVSGGQLSCKGTHKGSKLTHSITVNGQKKR